MSAVKLKGIVKHYGSHPVVNGLDLSVESGEFISLLGPSGCGKTTLLRIIAGLTPCDAGTVRVGDEDVTSQVAHQRNIGVVFQSYALFPHLTVAENIAFGLKARSASKADTALSVTAALRSVQLTAYADRPISALSGGQQQRVAVARAIATRPRLILLDEPLSALDRKLRETMQIELRQMLRDAGMTAIFVTHDQEEALVMSDRIAVMNHGVIEQCDSPERIYAKPCTEFALSFVGLSTQLNGNLGADQSSVHTPYGTIAIGPQATAGIQAGQSVLVGVRPERVHVTREVLPQQEGINRLSLEVSQTIYRGSNRLVYFKTNVPGVSPLLAEIPAHQDFAPCEGEVLCVSWPVIDTLVFSSLPSAQAATP